VLDARDKHGRFHGSHFNIWQFLNRKLARCNQVWLVRDGFDKTMRRLDGSFSIDRGDKAQEAAK
jgi:hypothetical protein